MNGVIFGAPTGENMALNIAMPKPLLAFLQDCENVLG